MSSATKILDIAERRMRMAGYNAVSYRDIAAEMGIKSASLHYHFQKKEDLGVALVKRYTARIKETLLEDTQDAEDPADKLKAYVDIYRTAFIDHQLVCLCAVLGAEAPGLPEPVTLEITKFFEDNIRWLTQVFTEIGNAAPLKSAKTTLALLEGAMIISSVNDDPSIFDAAADLVLKGK